MKITVKYKKATIIVDEADNNQKDQNTSMRWKDQLEAVHKTIIVMVEQCKLLKNNE